MVDRHAKHLILNADDAGLCVSVNVAIRHLFERGMLSSASVIVPAPEFEHFVQLMGATTAMPCGVHLALNSEWRSWRWRPVCPSREVSSLVDRDGYLHRNILQTLLKARAEHAYREFEAQIEMAKATPLRITHLDAHMGCYEIRPDLFKVAKTLARKHALPLRCALRYRSLALRYQKYQVNDRFYDVRTIKGERDRAELRLQRYLHRLSRLEPGITEIAVHPSVEGDDIKEITNTWYRRVNDYRTLNEPAIRSRLEHGDIVIGHHSGGFEATRPRPERRS